MKVEVKEKFSPIVITLENQEEVDAIFAIANFGSLNHKIDILNEIYNELTSYHSPKYDKTHKIIVEIFENEREKGKK